jgi:hypothetical protein
MAHSIFNGDVIDVPAHGPVEPLIYVEGTYAAAIRDNIAWGVAVLRAFQLMIHFMNSTAEQFGFEFIRPRLLPSGEAAETAGANRTLPRTRDEIGDAKLYRKDSCAFEVA